MCTADRLPRWIARTAVTLHSRGRRAKQSMRRETVGIGNCASFGALEGQW